MKILIFHAAQLPALGYGGTERVVLWLACGLRDLGHEVGVAALARSRLPEGVSLLELDPRNPSPESILGRVPEGTDLVHFMAPVSLNFVEKLGLPCVQTIHGNGKPGEQFLRNSIFLSRSHANRHGAQTFVYNGLDPSEFLFSDKKRPKKALFLSKTSWSVKNLSGAMRVINETPGWTLEIAGGNRPLGLRVKAALSSRFFWRGEVGGEQKRRLLSESCCLLFPTRWPEPFGLVVIEALMSGTPVIGSDCGSLPELLTKDVGFSLDLNRRSLWFNALERIAAGEIRSKTCQEVAIERFSHLQMAKSYQSCYEKVLKGETLNRATPVTQQGWTLHDSSL